MGGVLIAGISLPWYLLVTWKHGEAYLAAFFGYHNLERFTSVVNRHAAPWYFYFVIVLLGFCPLVTLSAWSDRPDPRLAASSLATTTP